MEIKDMAKQISEIAISKGWRDGEQNFAADIANFHDEISETWREHANNHDINEIYFKCNMTLQCMDYPLKCETCKNAKPCGIPIELFDAISRILEACVYYGIDIEKAAKLKMEFNKSRPYRHGNKRA